MSELFFFLTDHAAAVAVCGGIVALLLSAYR